MKTPRSPLFGSVALGILTEPKKIAESVSKTGFEASVKTPVEAPKAK